MTPPDAEGDRLSLQHPNNLMNSRPTHHSVLHFGAFTANLESGELWKHGIRIRLQIQPFQILTMLLERPNELVSREELQRKLWPSDTFVDFEQGLNKAVNKLRDADRKSTRLNSSHS